MSLGREVDLYDPNRQRKYFLEFSNGRGREFDLLQLSLPLSLNWNLSNPPRDSVLHWTYKYELQFIPLSQRFYHHEFNHSSDIHILYPLCNTTLHITTPTLFVAGSNSERITIRRPFATEGSTLNFQHNQGRNPLSVFECPYVRITIFWTRKKTIVLRIPIQSGDGQVVLIVTSVINTLLLKVYEVTSNLQIEANCNFHIWQYPLNSLMLPRSLQYQSIESISNEFYHRSSNDKITS